MTRIVPGWHPMIVHFPLALIVTAAMCLSLARLLPTQRCLPVLATVGTWNLCLGAVALLFALGSGLAAIIGLHASLAAHQAISAHVKSAMLTAILVSAVAVWRGVGAAHDSRPSWPFFAVLWAATAALIVTGYWGGRNVYRYGIGVDGVIQRDFIAPASKEPP